MIVATDTNIHVLRYSFTFEPVVSYTVGSRAVSLSWSPLTRSDQIILVAAFEDRSIRLFNGNNAVEVTANTIKRQLGDITVLKMDCCTGEYIASVGGHLD